MEGQEVIPAKWEQLVGFGCLGAGDRRGRPVPLLNVLRKEVPTHGLNSGLEKFFTRRALGKAS